MYIPERNDEIPASVKEWVGQVLKIAPGDLNSFRLKGGVSSAVYLIKSNDQRKWVLRLFTDKEWLEAEPDLALHETEALRSARQAGLNSPHCYAESLMSE